MKYEDMIAQLNDGLIELFKPREVRTHKMAIEPSDKLIAEYVQDGPGCVMVYEFETTKGETYRVKVDQDGGESVEDI